VISSLDLIEEGEVITTDGQVRKLMEEIGKGVGLEVAGLRAGMGRKTASKYAKLGRLPSEQKEPRNWRTRVDGFAEDWLEVERMLLDAPELEAKAIFEHLVARKPGLYQPGQVRTFQRRVQQWRAQSGPPREVFFAQEHRPGEAMQTDFTWGTSLGVTVSGVPLPHMLCHAVLPYSNWQWATVCYSESMAAIKRGVQAALFRLGRRPEWHQTDHSTAATHDLGDGKRGFNADYEAFVTHFGMRARTIGVGACEQNGDVEALNGALKRRLRQHLLLRASCDFESVAAYEEWVWGVLEAANKLRGDRLPRELQAMEPVVVARLPEYATQDVTVSAWSTIRVGHNAYSVPSRLIGESVRVHVYDDRLEVYLGGQQQLIVERLRGRNGHRINYRHIIWSLVRKPGAFARYKYQQDLFPSLTFRRAYDALQAWDPGTKGDVEYLRVLHLAASTLESEVQAALDLVLESGRLPDSETVKALVSPRATELPELRQPVVDLGVYDALLSDTAEVA
jgi:Mu transposase, C-terminal domain